MKYVVSLLVFWFAGVVPASARMGETPMQCIERYGQAVTNLPGKGRVTSVDVYVKDNIIVSLFIVRGEDSVDERVGMVFYSRVWPFEGTDPRRGERRSSVVTTDITTNEQAALIATIPGYWEDYTNPPPALAGRSEKVIPLTDLVGPTEQNREIASKAVRVAYKALYGSKSRLLTSVAPVDVAHNGPKIFAFRIGGGLVFCSVEAAHAINGWGSHVVRERTKVDLFRKDDLKGF